jgi:hypothetical protein
MDPDNKKCADCENENVNYVSINNGTVICSDCAEKHNHLSYWISYVKSFSEKWDDYLLKYIKNGGNSRYLKFCKDYKIENIKSLDRYKTRGVEYYRLILKSEVMGFDPPDNINVSSAGEILENIENNYPEFENYSFVKHVDLEKLEKQLEIDRKFNEENNAGIFQTFQGILGNFGKKFNEAKDNFVGKVNEKLNEEGGIIDKMKDMSDGIKIKYYEYMGKNEEADKIIKEKVKENERKKNNNVNNESQNKNIENLNLNDLKELKEQKNKSLSGKKLNEIIKNPNNENNNENNKEEKLNVENEDKKEETTTNKEKKIEKKEIITVEEKIIEKIEQPIEKNKNIEIKKEEKIIKNYEEPTLKDNKNEDKKEKKIIESEKTVTTNQESESKTNNQDNNEHLEELQQKITEKKEEKTKLDEILKEEDELEHKMPSNPEEIKQKLDDIINEKEDNEKNKPYRKISKEIQKTQTIESNRMSESDIFQKGTIRSVATSEMFLDENQLNEILGDDKEEEL